MNSSLGVSGQRSKENLIYQSLFSISEIMPEVSTMLHFGVVGAKHPGYYSDPDCSIERNNWGCEGGSG